MNLLKKLNNNDKAGFTYMERGITYMIIFFVGTFIIDLILLASTMITLNHQVNYIATKLSFQGGFIGTFTDTRHWTNEEIYNYLKGGMVKVGIDGDKYKWGLNYKENIKNGSWTTVINSGNNPAYNKTYKTSNSQNSYGVATNFHQSSSIRLWFDYKYKFSGKVFNFTNILTRLHFDVDFINEYIS